MRSICRKFQHLMRPPCGLIRKAHLSKIIAQLSKIISLLTIQVYTLCPFNASKIVPLVESQPTASLLPQHQIHNPAATNVQLVGVAAVVEDVVVVAAGILKCVCQNRHPVERGLFVNAACEEFHVRRAPRGVELDRAKRVAKDVLEKRALNSTFVANGLLPKRIYGCARPSG